MKPRDSRAAFRSSIYTDPVEQRFDPPMPFDLPNPCTPIACVAGKVGAPCNGSDNAACDSSPGAGDGSCDACAITAGQTTEDEMFVLNPFIVTQ